MGTQGGRHWFDRDTMRFFGTRISQDIYTVYDDETHVPSKSYFVTSEQPPHGPRKYSVRVYDWATREIDNFGTFCGYATLRGAKNAAHYAAYGDAKLAAALG